VLREVRALRALVAPTAPRPSGVGVDQELDGAVDSLRRLLSELLERKLGALAGDLVAIRRALTEGEPGMDVASAVARLDQVLDRLGVTQYAATRLDYVDPAIHDVVAERRVEQMPDGVVVETLRKGFRSATGLLIAKAGVAVNRKR
jgi:hypothetical protein